MQSRPGDYTENAACAGCRDRQSAVLAFQEAFRAAKASKVLQSWRGAPLQYPAIPTGAELMTTAKQAAQLMAALSESSTSLPFDAGAYLLALMFMIPAASLTYSQLQAGHSANGSPF